MSNKDRPTNLFDRHQNQRAKAKKERAKAKRFGYSTGESDERTSAETWEKFEKPEEEGEVGIVAEARNGVLLVLFKEQITPYKLDKTIPFELFNGLVVGDRVHIESREDGEWVTARVPRKNHLSRMRGDSTRFSPYGNEEQVVAANIDIAAIVASADQPRFHSGLVDRYLILCQNGGVNPMVCLNKADLTQERDPVLKWYQTKLSLEVIAASTITGEGLESLRRHLRNKIAVLVGNSGVGKSSIINGLNPELNIATKSVSQKSGEGRHTTTSSNLYEWEKGSFIIDTPGIRNLVVSDIPKEELRGYFHEFQPFQEECKYQDCVHDHEPECGVRQAVEKGEIAEERYESYLRILKDLV